MKILYLNDIHFGVHKNNVDFLKSQLSFLNYLIDNSEYDEVHILGDVFDNRRLVDMYILNEVNEFFLKFDCPVYITLGNHDMYMKNDTKINILKYLRNINPNVVLFDDVTEYTSNGVSILSVPFIHSKQQRNKVKQLIRRKRYDIIEGHFEFDRYVPFGQDKVDLYIDKADVLFSGHNHIYSTTMHRGLKVVHLGTQFHLNLGEVGNVPGAYIYDTVTKQVSFIENTKSVQYKYLKLSDILTTSGELIESIDYQNNYIILNLLQSELEMLGKTKIEQDLVLNDLLSQIKQKNIYSISKRYKNDVDVTINRNETTGDIELLNTYDIVNNYLNSICDIGDDKKHKIRDKLLPYFNNMENI